MSMSFFCSWNMLMKTVSVARDWSKSYGSVEVLEHTKGPIDPTHTFKAEGDGSFDEVTKKARLGFVIFVRGKLGRVQVFFEVDCSSSIEAELLVNIALQDELSKLKLSRGTVWTDSLFCYNVMVGKQTIGINDPNRELLLLLTSMRLKFESLIPEWKPRQLLSLPDAVIRVCKSKDNLRRNDVMDTLETLSTFLSGSPRFRLKWSKDADTWRKDFEMHWSDQTHIPGRSSSIYWRKVDDEESKVSMIKECIKVFISDRLLLTIDHLEDKSEGFQREIGNFIKSHGIQKWKIGSYSGFICRPYKPNSVLVLRDRLVIGCDATIPLDFYRSCETASTVILLPEAHEVGKLEEAGLSEVNAEAYINFHNIKLPLEKAELCNEGEKGNATQSKKGKEGKQRKKGKKGKKGKGRR